MDDGPRACRFCSREFHDSNVWIQRYNSRHSTIYRPAINRYRTCSRCFKFVTDEDVPTHRCRRLVPNSRSAANSSPGDASLPFDDPTSISVSLDEYLIHPVVVPDAPPTASSTRRATSIEEAPSARRSGSSSATSTEDPRGDLHETAEAVHDPPCQQPGDSEGPRPSKPTAADDPAAATQGLSSRRLRSTAATAAAVSTTAATAAAVSATAVTATTSATAATAAVGKGHRRSSRRTEDEPSRADIQATPANGGVQPPGQQGVPSVLAPGSPGQSSDRGTSDPPNHRVPFPSAPALQRRRVSGPRTQRPTRLSVSNRRSRRVSSPPVRQLIHHRSVPSPLNRGTHTLPAPDLPTTRRVSGLPRLTPGPPGLRCSDAAPDSPNPSSQRITCPNYQETPAPRSTPNRASRVQDQGWENTSVASEFHDDDEHSKTTISSNSSQRRDIPCPHPHCEKCFSTVKDTVKHINYTHRDRFPLPNTYERCSICHRVYTRDGVKLHQRKMHRVQLPSSGSPEEEHQDDRARPPPPLPANSPAISPDLDTLHAFYTFELTWIHAKWKPLLQQVHLLLMQKINSLNAMTSDESFSAYLLLPGFLEAVRIANRLPGAKQLRIEHPLTYLRTFAAAEHAEHPEHIIIATIKALHSRVSHSLETRPQLVQNRRSKELAKINALAQIGRISKAARLADTLERADNPDYGEANQKITSERAINILPELFPAASQLDDLGDRVDDEWDHGRQLQVTADEVSNAITKLSIDRASGFSGWSNRLLKQLYLGCDPGDQQILAGSYAQLFNSILKGRISERFRNHLTNVRLCLIPKSSNPSETKYRPIGVGETIFRLLGRTILNKIGKEIGEKVAPYQLAVGISGGVEIAASIAGILDAINNSQPADDHPFAMMSIDIKNAFNSIRRSHVLRGLRRHCPSLIPFFSTVYGQAVNLRWNDGSIIGTASTGVIQGDPLSTLYFALGIQPLLLDLQRKLRQIESDDTLPRYFRPGIVFAIADDITIQARTANLFKLSAELRGMFECYDLPLNLSKSWIMGTQVNLQVEEASIPCRSPQDGGKILGVPVGDLQFSLSWLRNHFRENGPPLRTLSLLSPRTSLTLVKFSYNPRMAYLRKTSPEVVISSGIFTTYDTLIDDALLIIGMADSRDRLHELRALPLTKGGLGMPLLNGHHGRRHHLIAAMRTREFLKSYHSHFIRDHTSTFNAKDIDIDGTPPDEIAETLYEIRAQHPTEGSLNTFGTALRKWSNDIDAESSVDFHQKLLADNDTAAAAVFLSSQGVKLSFVTYSTSHRLNTESQLNNREYIEALRFFFLAPFRRNVDGISTCRCRQANPWDLITHPFHASNCPLNSRERTFRHTAVCLLLCKLLRRASPTARVTLEPREATAARHPDIGVEDNALLFHVDVSIVEPTSMHALSENIAAATTKGAAALSKETAKIAAYSNTNWANVIPFVLESTGHLGKSAEDLLEKTTARQRPLRTWFLEELSLLLARTQGRMRLHSHALLR